jgi:hypothetical protein
MTATPPEAKPEYSRGPERSRGRSARGRAPAQVPPASRVRGWSAAGFAGGLIGALLLLVAEFTTLYAVHTSVSRAPLQSVSTGSHDAYALIPIGLLAAFLSFGVWRHGSRPALLAIGALGLLTALIALIGDLPDAQASGLIRTGTARYTTANSTAEAGLYLETLGAALLVIVSGVGFLLAGPPQRRRRPLSKTSTR